MAEPRTPVALAIAGSDSGGGAGIQADLKAFAAVGVHGTTAITAITAQSTVGVDAIHSVPPEVIVAQVAAVAGDIGVDAVKVGMLGTVATIDAVVEALTLVGDAPVVVDPVMVSESGATLLDEDARGALVERVLPLATVVTPNLPEARAIAGLGGDAGAEELAAAIRGLGPAAALVTGGHADGTDLLDDGGEGPLAIPGPSMPMAPLTVPAAPTARPSRRCWRSAGRCARRPPRPGSAPATPSQPGSATSAPVPAPSMRWRSLPGVRVSRCHNRNMKLVRMKPGFGDELLAEGDPDLADDEARLIEAFRRQLDLGMWAAVPTAAAGKREATLVREFGDVPRDADRVIFIPPAAGG